MKRYLWVLLCLAMALMLGTLPGAAEGFTSGDYEYRLDDERNAIITSYLGNKTTLVLPDNLDGHPVTEIGDEAFVQMNLKKVTLPDDLKRIGDGAFYNNKSLSAINLPEGLESIGASAFLWCGGLKKLVLPASLTFIGDGAFFECRGLSSVTMPEGMNASIDELAFGGCASLKSLTIPDSQETLGTNPFVQTPVSLKVSQKHPYLELVEGVLFDKQERRLIHYPYPGKKTSYEAPEGTLSIGDWAFCRNTKLTKVTLPEGLSYIGANAFLGIKNLAEVNFSRGLKEIGESAFMQNTKLKKATFQDGLSVIGAEAFLSCAGLTELVLPEGLKMIMREAFVGCDQLTGICLPASLMYIDPQAFGSSPQLMLTVLPGSYAATWAEKQAAAYAYPPGISAEDAPVKEEEADIALEETNSKRISKPAADRYPEVGFTDEVNQYFIDTMTEIFSSRKFYVYEREMLTAEDIPVKVRVIGRKDSLVEGYEDEGLTFLGEYVFNPDDPIFYYSDADRMKAYILSFNDLSLRVDPQNNPFDSSMGAPYYETLIYTESSFSQKEKFSVFSQIESGDLVLNLGYVGEPEIINDSTVDQGQTK